MSNSNHPGEDHQDQWTTLATFSWYQDALMLKMRLEASGITAMIPEQFTATINPGTTGMQVRVLVKGEQLEEAKDLIQLAPEPSPPETCPKCDSSELEKKTQAGRNWFRVLLGLLLVTPMRSKETKTCKKCG